MAFCSQTGMISIGVAEPESNGLRKIFHLGHAYPFRAPRGSTNRLSIVRR